MKQLITLILALCCSTLALYAQDNCCTGDSVANSQQSCSFFTGEFVSDETGLQMHLNLDEEDILIPGMSFLGPTNGYIDGKTNNHVYGVWMLLRFTVEGNKAKLRFTNDIGSDSQDIVLTRIDDNTIDYKTVGPGVITKVEGGRKLVKIATSMTLRRITQ